MGTWDETTGVQEVDDAMSINPFRRRRPSTGLGSGLVDALTQVGGNSATGDEPEPRLSHRITEDSHTNGNRSSGGPAALQPAKYEDPGQGRLKDLIDQEKRAEQPTPQPGFGRRLLNAAVDAGPTLIASMMGSAGGAVGADQAMQKGVARRQGQVDLAAKNKRDDVIKLKDQIEQESKGMEDRTFRHGEDEARNRVTEEGMNERARMAQEAETGRNNRLVETIKGQNDRQERGFGHQDDRDESLHQYRNQEEDHKQVGRMQLQHARAEAQQAAARIHAAAAGSKIPPIVAKAVDTFETSQSRMDVMQKSYEDAMRDPGNTQAQINLLASHIGMTMGLQPGARMNQAIIQEAMKSGYLDERIEAHFGPDGYLTGVVLTPRQMNQMVELAQTRLMEDARKVGEMEMYFGVQGHNGPVKPRIPGNTASPGAGAGGGAGATSPKTAEEYLKKRKAQASGARPN